MYRLLIGCIALLSVHDRSFVLAPPPLPSNGDFETFPSTDRNLDGAQDASTSVNNPESGCPCLTSVNSTAIPGQSGWLTQRQQHLEQLYSRNVMVQGMMCTCNVGLRSPMRDDYHYSGGIGAHKLHTRAVTWNDARKICNEEGGHLAIINSVAEAHVLLEIFNHSGPIKGAVYPDEAFLGVHDLYKEGDWVTVLGDSLAKTGYTRWSDKWGGQPDNGGGRQHCGALMKEGGMDDVACDVPFPFLCELPLMQVLH
ncbi:hemolymph lipopolysaccharide-binding protein [Harpegnathos saltator]|uniref:Hemolymph lipopolysaccharide-binding protein n=1 Tax=Harpegnathos saltator TaxID=610380 RepID=E2B5U5_HARSA|nr:hemolymph lipopolysaccharide-binding protein [Harpegnathos saltator]XP_011148638.1 hemolymph lipopolysaccharide-binding protein [Harpegnathos saltator]XP_011148647.1 hemolymph lipopolysaccharide-binding protein [Harpegnathos saltator]XP_011148651.1 hemolymph lipopolysaccharide-binding protein [Harpegnathos saltator]XP_011148658.1 hemolymph lipopolysaccharide-binding protein [Harpegnathos saltator]XP_025156785.1 hemolymph lipopolysaccharide-binding protein [Harpegnathos saltator]XP_02515678